MFLKHPLTTETQRNLTEVPCDDKSGSEFLGACKELKLGGKSPPPINVRKERRCNHASVTALCTTLDCGFLSIFQKFGKHHSNRIKSTLLLRTDEKFERKEMRRPAQGDVVTTELVNI